MLRELELFMEGVVPHLDAAASAPAKPVAAPLEVS